MKGAPTEAVFFDLDDTLHDDTDAYRRAAARIADRVAGTHAIDGAALLRAYVAEAEAFWKNLTAAQLGRPLVGVRASMWRSALEHVGIADAALAAECAAGYNLARKDFLQLFPGALDMLAALRARGARLGLVTNGFSETHREKLALLKLESAFDAVFIADEVGMLKPDPSLFRHACVTLGVAPEASAMVGDRYERDIRGAHDVGMFTVWMNVRNESVPAGAPQPDATVTSLEAVEGALPLPGKAR